MLMPPSLTGPKTHSLAVTSSESQRSPARDRPQETFLEMISRFLLPRHRVGQQGVVCHLMSVVEVV